MKIELAVFDLAGTTVNDPDAVSSCLRAALEAAGLSVSPVAVQAVRGLPKREAIHKLVESAAGRDDLLDHIDAIHGAFVARMVRFYGTDPSVYEIPGTSATFARLKQAGIKVGVNTGFSRGIVQVLLDRLGWSKNGLLDASVASDEVPRGRPHPDMIQRLMAQLGVSDPRIVVKVGDTPADLEEGVHAGCGLVVGVTQGTHSRQQLEKYPHTHLIDSVADLPGVLGI